MSLYCTVVPLKATAGSAFLLILLLLLLLLPVQANRVVAAEAGDKSIVRSDPVCGFYLHACWDYAYPFAVRKWKPKD